ncbi:hypothetical protein B0T10DRAFT_565866 [Thelonectria olida]|uniref:Xylanolytic transcriptional activator regulatory domain-containing protein n=1 Tax=Thelonectria olida TaxID=1576542 RepID=A0A9P9AK22_9HYPO|nr:hypothetical protein B0T10DRAFT_565866 [Thelonectria olida]
MLVTGLSYTDKKRLESEGFDGSAYTSAMLHEKTKNMAKMEMGRPRGITTIQGLLLLGSLDFRSSDNPAGSIQVGFPISSMLRLWLRHDSGLALRMVFDVGMHASPSSLGLTERDEQIRYMVLWASLVTDKFWSMYLGRPTTPNTSNIDPGCLFFDFSRLIACRPIVHQKKVGTRIYEAPLRLMELVTPLCETRFPSPSNTTETHLKIAAMEQSLKRWYSGLEADLKWPSEWQTFMPSSYFLLQ